MIDWITVVIPCSHLPLNGGNVCKTDRHGEIVWETNCYLSVPGSYDAEVRYRSVGGDGQRRATDLEVSGNPAKFLQGHNLFGSDDLIDLVYDVFLKICNQEDGLNPTVEEIQAVRRGFYIVRRIDITESYLLDSHAQVLEWIRAAEYSSKTRHGRSIRKGTTVYWGQTSKRWTIKAYSKYSELLAGKAHALPDDLANTDLIQWAEQILRVELTLRRKELNELGLDRAYLLQNQINNLYSQYIQRIDMTKQMTLSDENLMKLSPKLHRTYLLWKDGQNLRSYLTKPTYYRHRKELMKYGINIDLHLENSGLNNVVPLVRYLEAKPVDIPDWAFQQGLVHRSAKPKISRAV